MTKEKLQKYVDEGLSSYEIADRENKSPTTIRYHLKKHELKTKPKNTKKYSSKSEKQCADVKRRRLRKKEEAIQLKGGSCEICGYNKCNRALSFHHQDKATKIFELTSANLAGKKWEVVQEELEKCILVCANCHMEIHEKEDLE